MNPLVSVIVPVFNGEAHLGKAIASIIEQAHRPIEILVVDDGSTDGSAAIARSFPEVTYLHQPNAGVAAARNTGLRRARGELIAFLDQDDRWTPDKLSVQLSFLRAHHDTDFIFAHKLNVLEGEKPAWLASRLVGGAVPGLLPGTMLARSSAFHRVGYFDSTFVNGSDSEWVARARDLGLKSEILPEMLLWRHVHDRNESQNVEVSRREMFSLLRGSILRKREQERPSP
jgi:glycosyltransferase involved in cell wall biosynthesis